MRFGCKSAGNALEKRRTSLKGCCRNKRKNDTSVTMNTDKIDICKQARLVDGNGDKFNGFDYAGNKRNASRDKLGWPKEKRIYR